MNRLPVLITLVITAASLFSAEPIDVLTKTKWISDKIETLKWIEQHRLDLAKNGKYENVFGAMIIEFTKAKVATHLNGNGYVRDQKILGQTMKEIALETFDPGLKRDVIAIIEIDDNEKGYWIYESQFDVKEHFIPAP